MIKSWSSSDTTVHRGFAILLILNPSEPAPAHAQQNHTSLSSEIRPKRNKLDGKP